MRLNIIITLFSIFLLFCLSKAYAYNKSSLKDTVVAKPIQFGIASYYADKFEGRRTANGDIFSQQKFTAAHNTLPLGTHIKVTNLRNKKSVKVVINDRLHHRNRRLVDLSKAAAQKIGIINTGITRVKVEVIP